MKEILFFQPVNDFTGSSRVLSNIIQEEYSNIPVSVITLDRQGFLSELTNVSILPIYFPTIKGKSIPILSNLIRRLHICYLIIRHGLQHKKFYVNTIVPYYGAVAAKLLNKELTYHIHEYFIEKTPCIKRAEFVFNHIKSKRIFVSNYLKKCYKERSDSPYLIKYNALPKSYINRVKYKPLEHRKRNNIIMLTSLLKEKGIVNFILVAQLLPQFNFTLIISNTIECINRFISESEINTLPQNLKILPAQANIHPFFEESDLLLNLSNPQYCIETFGMTILEAMPYGIPAIVPNIGGPIELITNGYNGYCIDVTNTDEIKNKIQEILTNKTLYNKMSLNSLEQYKIFKN